VLIATLSTLTGLLIPSKVGGEILKKGIAPPNLRVLVTEDAATQALSGMSVFSKFVIEIDPNLRANDEVLITREEDELIGTGKLIIAPLEVKMFKRGVAVKIRKY